MPGAPTTEKKFRLVLLIVVAASAAIRLHALDRFSYGLDEILQTYWMNGTWRFFWDSIRFDAGHPPLDYLLAKGWEEIHPADWVRKIPVVTYGIATVAVYGRLIARRGGRAAGLFAATLLAVAPFHVRYSQELRPYSLALLLLCGALLCLDRYLERPSRTRLAVAFVLSLATVYTAYIPQVVLCLSGFALLFDDAFGADPVRRRTARRALVLSPVFLVGLWVAYLPWWPVQVEAASRHLAIPTAAPLTWARVGRILAFFSLAADGSYPLRIGDAFLLLLVLAGSIIALRKPGLRFLVVWAFGGLAVIEILWRLHPHWDVVRIYLPAGIALSSLAALPLAGLSRGRGSAISAALLAAVLILDIRGLGIYFREGRADWRPLARFLKARPVRERVFTENQYSQLCVAFYVVGPSWAFDLGRSGRQIPNLDGEVIRLTYSWPPSEIAWLVEAGEPPHPGLRAWARQFPSVRFPTAEEAVLHRLDPAFRSAAFESLRLH